MRTLEEMYDTPSLELTDLEYSTLCIAHGVDWYPGKPRAFAFMKPLWLFCPKPVYPCNQPGWAALR